MHFFGRKRKSYFNQALMRPIRVVSGRLLHRFQPLDRLIAATLRVFLKRYLDVDADPLRSLFCKSSTDAFKWLWAHGKPLMTIIMPVYNTDPEALERSIGSVIGQVYKKWELCIVDDASTLPHVKDILRGFEKVDPRISVSLSKKNEGISATINKGVKMAHGDFLGTLDHDDELAPLCLYEYVRLINMHPDADLIYCDEDKIDESGNYCEPWYKSDWNPDLSLSFNYVMHFALYRSSFFHRLGGYRSDYDGSQDYDLVLRAAEKSKAIYHIPEVLYHWRMGKGSIASGPDAKPGVFVNGLAALNDALKRRGVDGIAEDAPDAWKGVYRVKRKIKEGISSSIVIASQGDEDALLRLLKSIAAFVPSEFCEVFVCGNSSRGPSFETAEKAAPKHEIKCVECPGVWSLPAAFNRGARAASGDVLIFLDDTMEFFSSGSYYALLEHAGREEIGAVGSKLYYGEEDLLEHAGIVLGPFGILGYSHRATPDDTGYIGLKNMICNYSAVLGLGMMTRKQLFLKFGGFDEDLKRAYWDADYCLKLRREGLLITYTPYATFLHHVPVQAVADMIVEPEAGVFRRRWQEVIERDPYFNPHFSRGKEDFSFPPVKQSLQNQILQSEF